MIKHHHPTPVNPKRVVILGSAGFIARDLARYLDELGIDNLPVGSEQINLINPESVEQLGRLIQPDDALVISSALTPEKGKDVHTFMKNLLMINHVAAFFENARCRQVVYLSSDAVCDEQASLLSEATPRSPANLYGLMHVAREQMLQFVLGNRQVPLCIVRPCAIYGARDTHNSYGPNRFFRTALKDRKILLFGQGEERRDHIYIHDVTRFLSLCLQHASQGAVNLASGQTISFHDLAQWIVKLCPHPVPIECLPRSTPITHRHFDVSLRLREFPRFACTSLETGLAETGQELLSEANDCFF